MKPNLNMGFGDWSQMQNFVAVLEKMQERECCSTFSGVNAQATIANWLIAPCCQRSNLSQ
jgi:hypothetical protein